MIDRRFIGWRAAPATIAIEKGQLRLFAKATGETNPIYFDEQSALAQGWPALPAPPTFSFCLKQLAGQPYSYLREMGVDIASLLHGEQAFEYAAPIHAGDTITLNTEIVDIEQKKDAALEVITASTQAVDQHGRLCVQQRTVLIVRRR